MNFFEFEDQENSNNEDHQEIKSIQYKRSDQRHSFQISNSDSETPENEIDIQSSIETEQIKDNYFKEAEAPETNDFQFNQEKEYQNWSQREIKRLEEEIRDEGKRIVEEKKKEEETSESEENMQSKMKTKNEKMKFMQKYYHKGAYFEDLNKRSQELSQKNYTEATGLDLVDKEILPASMIARGNDVFKKGRSKWTNLENEDTSSKEPRLLIQNRPKQSGKKRKSVLFSSLNKKIT
jgi:microfibrillar-associated protein 1